ncbi:MAG: hydrogen gas-evolving membrane-bound hydrogenase subunit E, partial [Candidatus Limnocylindrales bacterium]
YRLHDAEVRDLRTSLAAVVLPTGLLIALAIVATPFDDAYLVGSFTLEDLPIVVLLGLAVVAALTVARDRRRLRAVLALSVLGFALAAVYAVARAPDVALVAVLIETMLTIVFIGIFSRLPVSQLDPGLVTQRPHRHRWHVGAGLLAGISAFAAVWAALSRTPFGLGDAAEQIALAPDAHGGDVVTVILADFRGLDTMVEITVLMVALIGAAGLLRRGRLW